MRSSDVFILKVSWEWEGGRLQKIRIFQVSSDITTGVWTHPEEDTARRVAPTAYPSHHNESPGDEFEQCPDANRGLDRGLWQGSGASEKVPAENCAIGFTDFPGSSSSGTFSGPWCDFTEF